jgi:hypothetical protein
MEPSKNNIEVNVSLGHYSPPLDEPPSTEEELSNTNQESESDGDWNMDGDFEEIPPPPGEDGDDDDHPLSPDY